MRKGIPCLLLAFLVALPTLSFAVERGIRVSARTQDGKSVPLYEDSYALVIGNGNYTNGWDPLPGALNDVEDVARALERNGFQVTLRKDLNRDAFMLELSRFSRKYGKDEDNRLLFYYAGHGHTEKTVTGDEFGYLVMVDAPLPLFKPEEFPLKCVDMQTMVNEARMIRSKHVLYLFDSCFSGSILNLREQVVPQNITENVRYPVRQFITAGRANEPVPDHSVFKQAFLNLLEGRQREPIADGYITGEELGLFLKTKVPEYNPAQHPQYGKIRDPRLDQGDFVFVAGGSVVITRPEPPQASEPLTGSLLVETRPSGAAVFVNEGRVDASPVKLPVLSPGKVEVRASLEGHRDGKETVWVQAGKETKVTLFLDPIPTTGSLQVTSHPSGARWYLDGAYVGATPGDMSNVAAGSHKVTVKLDQYRDWEKTVTVSLGGRETVKAELIPVRKEAASGETWRDPTTGMEFVRVSGGCFQMGQTEAEKRYLIKEVGEEKYKEWYGDELPRHEVCVDGFWTAKHEVTVDQFREFVDATGYKTEAEQSGGCYAYEGEWKKKEGTSWRNPPTVEQQSNHPVVCVSWNDAKAFAKWLSGESGKKVRLPTEAEWEYAARAGTSTIRFWGDNADDACSYANVADQAAKKRWSDWTAHNCDDGYATTAPVGTYKPNPFGLYDMLGNVYEWCDDWYNKDAYSKHRRDNPIYDSGGFGRVVRGGGWYVSPGGVRCANRINFGAPDIRFFYLGFRLLRTD
ncbi:MAG: SUMF1/EgtB/PvdO family nonheme iron enzyme [Deltaproteobacteria bacterium]|nr:SUMF1/EgtB/PvdO family nonheme iron enzyme [Deltaproteobacteria bacterium]